MKKLVLFFTLFPIFSCKLTSYSALNYNEQQIHFIQFIHSLYSDYYHSGELKTFDQELENYLDSLQLFIGWKGTLKKMEPQASTVPQPIHYEISFEGIDGEIFTFIGCNNYEIDKEYHHQHIYERLMNIPSGFTIYFDGFIKTDLYGSIQYGINDKERLYDRSTYHFIPIEIYTSKPEPFSPQLLKALKIRYRQGALYRKGVYGKMPQAVYKKALSEIKEIDEKALTDDENYYLTRFTINQMTFLSE